MSRESRMELHSQAKEQMAKSQWQKALHLIYKARHEYGGNLMLLVDQAACEYMDGSPFTWRQTLDEIERTLADNQEILSQNTLYNVRLFVGKFQEELGQFVTALSHYESILGGSLDDRQKLMAQAQVLRMQCLLGQLDRVQVSYVELRSRLKAFKTENQRMEMQHALMLADLELIGVEAAYDRLILNAEASPAASDLNLMFYDLLEGAILKGQAHLLAKANAPDPLDEYEQALLRIRDGEIVTFRDTLAKADHLSLTTQFRLAVLVQRFGATVADRESALGLIRVLLRSFDRQSVKALTTRFHLGLVDEPDVVIQIQKNHVRIKEQSLNWGRRATALALLKLVALHPKVSEHELVRLVWNTDFNSTYSDRLRMLVRRINAELAAYLLRPECLVFRDGELRLAEGLRVEAS